MRWVLASVEIRLATPGKTSAAIRRALVKAVCLLGSAVVFAEPTTSSFAYQPNIARFRLFQEQGTADFPSETPRPRAMCRMPCGFSGLGVPSAATWTRQQELERRGVTPKLRSREAIGCAGRPEEPIARTPPRGRSRRRFLSQWRKALRLKGRPRVANLESLGARTDGQWHPVGESLLERRS
jgi:hypothetical protein